MCWIISCSNKIILDIVIEPPYLCDMKHLITSYKQLLSTIKKYGNYYELDIWVDGEVVLYEWQQTEYSQGMNKMRQLGREKQDISEHKILYINPVWKFVTIWIPEKYDSVKHFGKMSYPFYITVKNI